jgi:hypothetical protein
MEVLLRQFAELAFGIFDFANCNMTAPQKPSRGSNRSITRGGDGKCSVSIWFLILSYVLVFQMTCFRNTRRTKTDISNFSAQQQDASSYILDFPRGTAVALPSIQVDEAENEEIDRKQCE